MNASKPATHIEHQHFLELFLAKRSLYPFYTSVRNLFSNKLIYDQAVNSNNYFSGKTIIIKDIPDYLDVRIPYKNNKIKIKKATTYQGYAIDIKPYNNLNDYLSDNFGKASRSKLRRYQNRLENCFNISYKMYYGEISEGEFAFIFKALRSMLEKRFAQKKEENYELQNWEKYQKSIFPLINDKKACVFVIYHDSKPIDICVNLIYDKIAYFNMSGYDIDYASFSLGSIDMLKLIEWCIDNKLETIDLLKGYYYYKQKWINKIYDYQNHFIYDATSLPMVCYANFKALSTKYFYKFFHLLKKWKLDVHYHNLKRKLYKSDLPEIDFSLQINSKPLELNEIPPSDELKEITLDKPEYNYLRKILYDFLYTSHESINTLKILEHKKYPNTFVFKGKIKNIEVIFTDQPLHRIRD